MSSQSLKIPKPSRKISGFLPILSWLPHYNRTWLSLDIIAGLTLWGLVVPEAMAYAGIAGLPPQAGLYTLVASLLIYALLGTARHLSVGPTSATSALLASSVATLLVSTAAINASDPATYQTYATAFVLVVGIVFLVAGLARFGFITQFLSKPVMDGFVMGLAIFVAVGQLNKLFGVSKPNGNTVEKFVGIIKQLSQANWVTFAVGITAMGLLFLLPRLSKKIPAGLVVLFGFILVSSLLKLSDLYGVSVVGKLPQGLPALVIPKLPITAYLSMLLPAIGVLLVAFSEALGVAHEFADKHGYDVNADQELNAHAVVNLGSALFGGMIASGGMSASAVKEGAGGRTQVTNLVAWIFTIITLLFLTPLFTQLPEAVLAALIIHAVWHIIASRKLQKIRSASPVEFWFGVLALLGVILIDVLPGMVIGLVASLVFVIYKSSRPHLSSLGRVPGIPGAYSDLSRHPENIPVPGILILRLDAPIYYANAQTVRELVRSYIAVTQPPPRAVVLDSTAEDNLDITSVEMLKSLLGELKGKGIAVYVADVHAPVAEAARRMGLNELIS
ncbi:MAG: sulfate permease [Anaerolineae bacterium]|nr:sulfate permease [Anaerolineae bacterium]